MEVQSWKESQLMCKYREWAKSPKCLFLFRAGPSWPWVQDNGIIVSLIVPGCAPSLAADGAEYLQGNGDGFSPLARGEKNLRMAREL